MRCLVLLAFVVTAIAAFSYQNFDETTYVSGKEYVYRYETQILSGIKTASKQLAGLKLLCQVHLQIQPQESVAVLKLKNINVFEINKEVPILQQQGVLPDYLLTELPEDIKRNLREDLEKPLKFQYVNGAVLEVYSSSEDTYWSINIKKGILSALQLRISTKYQNSNLSPASHSFLTPFRSYGTPVKVFDSVEPDVLGDCVSVYAVYDDQVRSSDPFQTRDVLGSGSLSGDKTVLKVRDASSCLKASSKQVGLYAGLPHLSDEKDLIDGSVTVESQIKGDLEHFLVKKVEVKGKYHFTPFVKEGGHVSTHVIQKLVLQGVSQFSHDYSQVSSGFVKEKQGLLLTVPATELHQHDVVQDDQEKTTVFGLKLNELTTLVVSNPVETSIPYKMMQLTLLLKELSKETLVQLYDQYLPGSRLTGPPKTKFNLFADLLPTVQSPAIVPTIAQLIATQRLTEHRAGFSLNGIALTAFPTSKNIEVLIALYKSIGQSSGPRECSHLRQTVLLTIGSLGGKLAVLSRQNKVNPVEARTILDKIVVEFTRLLASPRDVLEKIAVVKAMGNLGSKRCAQALVPIVQSKSISESLRLHAIYALRKISVAYPMEVQPICVSIFLDRTETIRIRQAAFDVVRNGHPSLYTLQLIGKSLKDEPSHQIKSYVYTSLVAQAKHVSKLRVWQLTSENARKVLKQIRPVVPNVLDSKALDAQLFCEQLNMGGILNLRSIKQSHSPLPDKFVVSSHGHVFDNYLKFFEAGVQYNGLYSMFRKQFGPYGSFWTEGAQGFRTEINLPEDIKSWWSEKYSTHRQEEPQFEAFMDVLGHELQFVELNPEKISTLKAQLQAFLGLLSQAQSRRFEINFEQSVAMTSNSLVVPTPAGIPLSLNVSFGGILMVKGHLTPFMEGLYRNVKLDGQIEPTINAQVFAYMGVDVQWLRTGVAVKGLLKGSVGLAGSFSLNLPEKKLAIRSVVSPNKPKFLEIEVVPATFVYHVPKSGMKLPFCYDLKELNVHDNAVLLQRSYELELFGLKGTMVTKLTKSATSWGPFPPLSGKQALFVKLQGTTEIDEEVYLKLSQWSQEPGLGEYGMQSKSHEELQTYSNGLQWTNDNINTLFSSPLTPGPNWQPITIDPTFSGPKKAVAVLEVGSTNSGKVHATTQITYAHGQTYFEQQLALQVLVPTWPTTRQPVKMEVHASLRLPPRHPHTFQEHSVFKFSLKTHTPGSTVQENLVHIDVKRTNVTSWLRELQKIHPDHLATKLSTTPADHIYKADIGIQKYTPLARKWVIVALDYIKNGKFWSVTTRVPERFMELRQRQGEFIKTLVHYVPRFERLSTIVESSDEIVYAEGIAFKAPILGGFVDPGFSDENPLSFYRNASYNFHYDPEFEHSHLDQVFPLSDESELNVDDQDDVPESLSEESWLAERPMTPRYPTRFTGKCKIFENHLTTFDGLPVMLPTNPSQSCKVLLAKDCATENTFAIVGSQQEGKWSVVIYTPNKVVELVSTPTGTYLAKVDGQPLRIENHLQSYEGVDGLKLVRTGKGGYKCFVKQLGLSVKVEVGKVYLSLSPLSFLQGRVCGLCGDYNSDPSNDLMNLNRLPAPSHHSYVLDKLIPSSQCTVETYKGLINQRYNQGCQKQRTLRINRSDLQGDIQVCFSTEPVPKCASGCQPVETELTKVDFKCYPETSVPHLVQKWETYKVLSPVELSSVPVGSQYLVESVPVPKSCTCTHTELY